MTKRIQEFIEIVSVKNKFQKNYLQTWNVSEQEKEELELLLKFYQELHGYTMEFLAESYLFINEMVMEETYYFVQNGSYRNTTFEQVNDYVYQNEEYMTKYMCGLTISDYIWHQHLEVLRYFERFLLTAKGEEYLEIGPGFGQFLARAIDKNQFKHYLAVDLSETSVQGCKKYIEYRMRKMCHLIDKRFVNTGGGYEVIRKNFFEFEDNKKFDCIVMGEVLEHVEQPLQMLQKISVLLSKGGKAFLTTVINAPAIDHIYLFSSEKEILEMIRKAGLRVIEHMCATAGNISLEKALKKKKAITIAAIVEREENEYK